MSINPSDVSRLVLAAGGSIDFMTEQEFGGHNRLTGEVFADKGPTPAELQAGQSSPGDATVKVFTSEDNSTFSQVGNDIVVKPGGSAVMPALAVGPYCRITCAGNMVRINLRSGNQLDANGIL
jgi:hypothetical protein